jgi:hypothetical protein
MDPYREPIEAHDAKNKFPTVAPVDAGGTPVPPRPPQPQPETAPMVRGPAAQIGVPPRPAIHDEVQPMPPPTPGVKPPLETLRTFEADAAYAVDQQKASVLTIALAEQRKKADAEVVKNLTPEEKTSRYKSMIIVSAIFLALGCVVLGFVYARYSLKSDPDVVAPTSQTLIIADHTKTVTITDKETGQLRQEVSQIVRSAQPGVTHIHFVEKSRGKQEEATPQNVIVAMRMTAPDSLVRSFTPNYMIGAVNPDGGTAAPFMLFRPESFETAFAGMLEWESNLGEIIRQVFELDPVALTGSYLDVVVRNTDARILKNTEGQTVVVYALPDRRTVVITTSEQALTEILTRLTSTNYVPR